MAATLEHVLRSQRTDIITSDDFALLSREIEVEFEQYTICLLYTSDAADDLLCVDLGGRRIIKKKKKKEK